MNGTYDYGELRALTKLCPYLPYLCRTVGVKPELLEAIERAEKELAKNEIPADKTH